MHPRLASYAASELGMRSARSSLSQGTLHRTASGASNATFVAMRSPAGAFEGLAEDNEDDAIGAFAEDTATLQAQNRALRADIADKNRYINTLEKRLIQARRSSHSRVSAAFSPITTLQEKDAEIESLRSQLEDRDRTITALRSAARKLQNAETPVTTPTSPSGTNSHQAKNSTGGSSVHTAATSNSASLSPVDLVSSAGPLPLHSSSKPAQLPPPRGASSFDPRPGSSAALQPPAKSNANRRSVDEMSRILDEMIQDRVERGDLVRTGRNGSIKARHSRRKESLCDIPSVEALAKSMRPESQRVSASEIAGAKGLGLGVEGVTT
jgi:centromeric protein E